MVHRRVHHEEALYLLAVQALRQEVMLLRRVHHVAVRHRRRHEAQAAALTTQVHRAVVTHRGLHIHQVVARVAVDIREVTQAVALHVAEAQAVLLVVVDKKI